MCFISIGSRIIIIFITISTIIGRITKCKSNNKCSNYIIINVLPVPLSPSLSSLNLIFVISAYIILTFLFIQPHTQTEEKRWEKRRNREVQTRRKRKKTETDKRKEKERK